MKFPYTSKNTMLVKIIVVQITAHEDRTREIIKKLDFKALNALIQ